MKRYLSPLILSLFVMNQACTTVQSISISQIPPAANRKEKLTSQASNIVLLSIPFGNSFVEKARDDLLGRCQNGRLEGMLTKHQSTNYFFGIFTNQEVLMQAYCLKTAKKG